MNVVVTKNLSKVFYLGKTKVHALNGVSIEIQDGEFLAIAGPSGSGKTTLLNLIGCIDQPTKGSIIIDGDIVDGLSSNELADIRSSKLSFIFQSFNLIPVLSAFENVEYPLLKIEKNKKQRRERVLTALQNVGLEQFVEHRPNELSGGQRQRVAIARALVTRPRIILADEPTANLDQKTGESILNLMKKINEEHNTLFIFSTHDPKVMRIASRIIRISDGEIVEYSHIDRRSDETNEKNVEENEHLLRNKGRRDFD